VPPEGQGFQGTILYLYPPSNNVIVNLSKLYRDAAFRDAMEKNKANIMGFYDGAGHYGDSQSEVVLEIDAVSPEDVYSLGGWSSSLEELVSQAAHLVYGRPGTQIERDDLLLKASQAGVNVGPAWLNMNATRRVLARTKPVAAALAEMKRCQEASKL